jgi:biopolymer transport protein ExbD
MRNKKSIRKRGRREKSEPFELDITSLLDILVILLVFLLRSYNSNTVTMTVPQGISLPGSVSKQVNTQGVMIQVSSSKIWVDDKEILNVSEPHERMFDRGGRRIIPLFNELTKKKEEIQQIAKMAPNAKKFSGVANLIIDKTLKYNYIKKLMYTCAEAGFRRYNFVVLGNDN